MGIWWLLAYVFVPLWEFSAELLKLQSNFSAPLLRALLPPTRIALSYDVVLIDQAFLCCLREQLELFALLIQLLLRMLATPRMWTSLLISETHFFELHGLGRPPRDLRWALAAGLSPMGRTCSSLDPA